MLHFAGTKVAALMGLVVLDADDLLSVNLLGRIATIVAHHLLYLFGSTLAFAHHTQ